MIERVYASHLEGEMNIEMIQSRQKVKMERQREIDISQIKR